MNLTPSFFFRAILGLLCCSGLGRAEFEAFLRLEGLDGEHSDARRTNWIRVIDLSIGVANTGAGAQFTPLLVTKLVDKTSPLLARQCAEHGPIRSAILEVAAAGSNGIRFHEVKLENVLLIQISTAGHTPDTAGRPRETVAMGYTQVSWTSTALSRPAGLPVAHVGATWDLLSNKGSDQTAASRFQFLGIRQGLNQVTLSWDALASRTYRVYGSGRVEGRYTVIGDRTPPVTGRFSTVLPADASKFFFVVEELPGP